MEQKISNSAVGYMIEGAKRSRYNAQHWFRYLRKGIKDDKILFTAEEINMIINSGQLTMYQIVTLKRAMTLGTPTNRYVARLNQKSTTPMVREVMRRRQNA